jgi:hapalindole-type alkaloid chlorinase
MNNAIRHLELQSADSGNCSAILEDIYNDTMDAVVLRGVFSTPALQQVQQALAKTDIESAWHEPNAGFQGLGIRVLGLAATRCGTMPNGPSKDDYFTSAAARPEALTALFGSAFDPVAQIETAIGRLAGGRPVELPRTADGRAYGPCTVRSLSQGEGILLHHDNHYPIPVYDELLPQLDSSTCISFFVVLKQPEKGGRLYLYSLKRDEEGDLPRLPGGQLDPQAVDRLISHTRFDLHEGDMIVFNAGKIYHRVDAVEGSRSRVTMGGFMALDKPHTRVYYWS